MTEALEPIVSTAGEIVLLMHSVFSKGGVTSCPANDVILEFMPIWAGSCACAFAEEMQQTSLVLYDYSMVHVTAKMRRFFMWGLFHFMS